MLFKFVQVVTSIETKVGKEWSRNPYKLLYYVQIFCLFTQSLSCLLTYWQKHRKSQNTTQILRHNAYATFTLRHSFSFGISIFSSMRQQIHAVEPSGSGHMNGCVRLRLSIPAPRMDGKCEFVSSTNRSLTFRWSPAMSSSSYRLVGHSVNNSYTTTEVTVDDLTPGSFYTFVVTAIGSQGLDSNSISCNNSTSESNFLCWRFLPMNQTNNNTSFVSGYSTIFTMAFVR